MLDILSILGNLEYVMSLQFLVDFGDFYAAKCADIGGTWQALADNSYECVNTDLDRWLEKVVRDI